VTPLEHARWWLDFGRLQLDRFLRERHGAARLAIAATLLLVLWRPAVAVDRWLAGMPQVHQVAGQPVQHAWIQIVWYLVILVVAAVLAYALAPKPKEPEPGKSRIPEADDGKAIIHVFGTVWIEDPMVLAFKRMGEVPIKKKAGK
jgi:hypothetical protein